MKQSIVQVTLVVPDYDEALAFYVGILGFDVVEDTVLTEANRRWVVIAPSGDAGGASLVLGLAGNSRQKMAIGNQSGGRVFLFLQTDDFARDHKAMAARGVRFIKDPRREAYGTVAVFADPFGNLWDLIEYAPGHPLAPPNPVS